MRTAEQPAHRWGPGGWRTSKGGTCLAVQGDGGQRALPEQAAGLVTAIQRDQPVPVGYLGEEAPGPNTSIILTHPIFIGKKTFKYKLHSNAHWILNNSPHHGQYHWGGWSQIADEKAHSTN